MNTTNIFVELVVIGFHTLVWMGLIILTFVGYEHLNVEKLFTINLALPTLAVAYILGILVDRFSDLVLKSQDLRPKTLPESQDLPSFLTMRYYVLNKSSDMYEQLEYTRSRLRIARASIPNFALTTVAMLFLVWFQLGKSLPLQQRTVACVATAIIGALLTLISYKSWVTLARTYTISTITAFRVLQDEESKK